MLLMLMVCNESLVLDYPGLETFNGISVDSPEE